MLQSMKSGFMSGLFFVILGVAGVGLVMTDWTGTLTNAPGVRDAATVNGESISLAVINRNVENFARAQGISNAEAYESGLVDQILNFEIQKHVLHNFAKENGVVLGDEHVADLLSDFIAPYRQDGESIKETFDRIRLISGMSQDQIIEDMRIEDANRLVMQALFPEKSTLPDQMRNDLSAAYFQDYDVTFTHIPFDTFKVDTMPDEQQLKSLYASNIRLFQTPASVDLSVAILPVHKLKSGITITASDVKTYYEDNPEQFEQAARRKVAQVILSDEAQALALIKAAKASDLKAATDEIVQEEGAYSEQFYSQGDLIEELMAPVFDVAEGKISGPIKTALGYHVFTVLESEEAKTLGFDTIKDQLRTEMKEQALEDALYGITVELDNRLFDGLSFPSIIDGYNFDVKSFENIAVNQDEFLNINTLSEEDRQYLIQNVAEFGVNDPTRLYELPSGGLAVVNLDRDIPAQAKPFDTVQQEVTTLWQKIEKETLAKTASEKVVDQLNSGATEISYPQQSKTLSRDLNVNSVYDVTPDRFAVLFGLQKGEVYTFKTDTGFVVSQVNKVVASQNDDGKADYADSIEAAWRQARIESFVNYLMQNAEVDINRSILDQLYVPREDVY